MKEIFVRKDMFGTYTGIDLTEALDLVKNHMYSAVSFETDDRIISIVFWAPFGADQESMKEAASDYFRYISSITGLDLPVEVEMQ